MSTNNISLPSTFLTVFLISITIHPALSACANNANCFDCSSDPQCGWNSLTNSCSEASSTSPSKIYTRMQTCWSDLKSQEIMKNNCDNLSKSSLPIDISILKNTSGSYGFPNLYCEWVIDINNSDRQVLIEIQRALPRDKSETAWIDLTFYDSTSKIISVEKENYTIKSKAISSIKVMFYNKEPSDVAPWTGSVCYDEYWTIFNLIWICLLSVFIVTVLLIFAIIAYQCYKIIKKKAQNEERRGTVGANVGSIAHEDEEEKKKKNKEKIKDMLKVRAYDNKSEEEVGIVCTVCFDPFVNGSRVIAWGCQHLFHENCILEWLDKIILNPKCPNCNAEIIKRKEGAEDKEMLRLSNNSYSPGGRNGRQRVNRLETSDLRIEIQRNLNNNNNDNNNNVQGIEV